MLTWRSLKYQIALLLNIVAVAVGFAAGSMWIPMLVSPFGFVGKVLVVMATLVLLLWMVRFFSARDTVT